MTCYACNTYMHFMQVNIYTFSLQLFVLIMYKRLINFSELKELAQITCYLAYL